MSKIVALGAGSYSFGLSTLITLLQSEVLRGSEIALVDTNQQSLDVILPLANWLNKAWDCGKVITAHSSYKTALKGADFVISAIEVQPREALWKQDFQLTEKYGLRQPYAENGGPGGFAHAARNVNGILEIAHDMERDCPGAWLINFTNPMHRLCYLVNEYTSIKVVGLCHQLAVGYAMAAKALAAELGVENAGDFVSSHADPKNHEPTTRLAKAGLSSLQIKAAGLNHFTWMLGLKNRATGEDLYPLFRERWQQLPADFEPLTRAIFDAFGHFPIPGDEHLCEYLPWMSNPQTRPWQKFDLSLYDWQIFDHLREAQWERLSGEIGSSTAADSYAHPDSEGACEIIEAALTDSNLYWEALNLPNRGSIAGLPDNAIVEVPGWVNHAGLLPEMIGELPLGILSLLQREVATSQLNIDAVVKGDRQLALQSLLLDPVVNDIDIASALLEDILVTYREYLPQFWD